MEDSLLDSILSTTLSYATKSTLPYFYGGLISLLGQFLAIEYNDTIRGGDKAALFITFELD